MKRGWLILALFVLGGGAGAWWFGILGELLIGWAGFLLRVVPELTFDRVALAYAFAALALLLCGVHFTAGWLYRHMSAGNPPRAWRWRSSAAIVAGLLTLFTASIAMVGIVHQGTWLMTREKLWRVPRARLYSSSSRENLRSIASALESCEQAEKSLPKGGTFNEQGEDLHGWALPALPYLNYYAAGVDRTKPWNHPSNVDVLRAPVPALINPAFGADQMHDADGYGVSHYAVNQHVMGPGHALSLSDLQGETAGTLLVGEINANFRPWASSHNCRDPLLGINASPDGFGGPPGQGGAYFAMADGSVRFIAEDIDPQLLRTMSAVDRVKK